MAIRMAQEMRLPLLAKDLNKETLMSVLAVPDLDTSRMLGQATVEVMYTVAAASSGGAVLVCRCDREVALTRY